MNIDLTEVARLTDKINAGGKLTKAEKEFVANAVSTLSEFFTPLLDALVEALVAVSTALIEWWDSLPSDSKRAIEQSSHKAITERKNTLSSLPMADFNPSHLHFDPTRMIQPPVPRERYRY